MDPSLDAQRLNPSPRRGEGGGRFGHQVRVLSQRAQRAIQKISALSLRYARGVGPLGVMCIKTCASTILPRAGGSQTHE